MRNACFQCSVGKQWVCQKLWGVKTANQSTGWNDYECADISVQFNAPGTALWRVENVNFMPYRLWLKSLMDTCREHDRLISVFHKALCPSLLECFFPSTAMVRKEMEKTCTRWDIRPLIRDTLLSLCVYLSASTKCTQHIDVLKNTLRHLDCSWPGEHDDITPPLIWDDVVDSITTKEVECRRHTCSYTESEWKHAKTSLFDKQSFLNVIFMTQRQVYYLNW